MHRNSFRRVNRSSRPPFPPPAVRRVPVSSVVTPARSTLPEPGAPHAGIDFRQPQQRIEDIYDPVDVSDRVLNFVICPRRRRPGAISVSSRARNSASGVRRSCATTLDALRTPSISCSICSSMVLIVWASRSNSSDDPRVGTRRDKSPRYDRAGGTIDGLDPTEHRTSHNNATDNGQDQCAERRPTKGADDQRADLDAILHVASHQQTKPAGQNAEQRPGHVQVAVSYQIDLVPAGRRSARRAARPVSYRPTASASDRSSR